MTMTMDVPLLLGVGVYFLSSIGGVSVVKLLNYHFCITSWWIFAIVSRSTWVLSAALHLIFLKCKTTGGAGGAGAASTRQLRLYCIIAVGLSLVEAINSFSMSTLPGSLYMLLKGSDVGWSMILSRLMLENKSYGATKMLAAALVMLGIGAVLILDVIGVGGEATDGVQHHDDQTIGDADASHHAGRVSATTTASMLCLGGAFLNSLCSVGTEAMLKRTLQEEQEELYRQVDRQQQSMVMASPPSNKLLLSNAYSMYTSFFSFVMLIPLILISKEDKNGDGEQQLTSSNSTITCDGENLNGTETDSETETDTPHSILLAIGLCLAMLAISRFLERLCKHFICVYDSAVTFSIVQAARRWLGIYIVGVIFHEDFERGMIIGSLVSGAGFVLHGYEASRASQSGERRKNYKKLASNLSGTDSDGVDAPTSDGEIEIPENRLSAEKS